MVRPFLCILAYSPVRNGQDALGHAEALAQVCTCWVVELSKEQSKVHSTFIG